MIELFNILFPSEAGCSQTVDQNHSPFQRDGNIWRTPFLYARNKNGSIRSYRVIVDATNEVILRAEKQSVLGGKITTDEYIYSRGVNEGKSNEKSPLEKALFDAESTIRVLQDKGFSFDLPTEQYNTDANGVIKPMLAQGYSSKRVQYPCLVQPKFDGVRCLMLEVNGEVVLLSRNGKPYNIPHLKKWGEQNRHLLPLDGELYNHKELTFQEIISAVKRVSTLTDKIRYVVYDAPIAGDENFRRNRLCGITGDFPVQLSPTIECRNEKHLVKLHKEFVTQGYEGAMVRNYCGEYEFGFRSKNLMKYKTFDDAEFEIVDVEEATGRDIGTAILVCKCGGGYFRAKPQGTREYRSEMWDNRTSLVGKMATIQYQGKSDDGIPRFPSAISIRDYE